jgi:hypothetical protein
VNFFFVCLCFAFFFGIFPNTNFSIKELVEVSLLCLSDFSGSVSILVGPFGYFVQIVSWKLFVKEAVVSEEFIDENAKTRTSKDDEVCELSIVHLHDHAANA